MCWSFGASAIFAILGFAVAGYLAYKKKSKLLWIPIGYFAIMELLQTLAYLTLNDCTSHFNQIIAFLGYLHITFQPFFANAFLMYFIPKKVMNKISVVVYGLCFLGAILMLTQLYPFDWAGSCISGKAYLCGPQICSASGSWHLVWTLPLNAIPTISIIGYMFMAFILPLLYGSWKGAIAHALMGPGLATLLSATMNEMPAIWCLFSIGMMLIALYTPMREFIRVKKWYFWKYPW